MDFLVGLASGFVSGVFLVLIARSWQENKEQDDIADAVRTAEAMRGVAESAARAICERTVNEAMSLHYNIGHPTAPGCHHPKGCTCSSPKKR